MKHKIEKLSVRDHVIEALKEMGLAVSDDEKKPINGRYSGAVGSRTKPLVVSFPTKDH
ncbi:hypothetical protein J2T17_004452 [Paenibacillus mucilaginosus]|uniref:hypothetical protein n=1 Tax=Paenibacillus mucilaginosus TaxID=61624 RepID=UPI003D196FF3